MRLAVIDLDGVVANVDARFSRAKADAEAAFVDQAYERREYDNVYWRAVFNPAYVSLDTPIDGVNEALLDIQQEGYKVVFLTSRPESMRDATAFWLFGHSVYDGDDELVMKTGAFQYTKTTVWKAGMVQTLVSLYNAEALLVVDDEMANILEITKYSESLPAFTAAKSLAEAVAKLNGTWVEPDPFLPPE